MFVARPEKVRVRGFVWHEDFESQPKQLDQIISGQQAGFLQHEADHLAGGDASTHPERLFDPWADTGSFAQIHHIPQSQVDEAKAYLRRNSDLQFLIYRDGKVLLVRGDNHTIGPFLDQ